MLEPQAALAGRGRDARGDERAAASTRPPAATRSTSTRCSPRTTARRARWSTRSRCGSSALPAAVHGARPRDRGRRDGGGTIAARARRARRARRRRGRRGADGRADILRGDDFAHPLVAPGRLRGDPGRRSAPSCTPRPPGCVDRPRARRRAGDGRRPRRRRLGRRGAAEPRPPRPGRAARRTRPATLLRRARRGGAAARRSSSGCCASSPARWSPPRARTASRPCARRSRSPRRRSARRSSLELGRALFAQGYFADAADGLRAGHERGRRRRRARDGRGARPLARPPLRRARRDRGAACPAPPVARVDRGRPRPPAATAPTTPRPRSRERAADRRSPRRSSR